MKNLSIDDLDLDNGKFSIIGKGNKERTGYINKMTKKAIEEYLRIRDNFNPKTKTLLVSIMWVKNEFYSYRKDYKKKLINYLELMMKTIVFILYDILVQHYYIEMVLILELFKNY